MLVFGFRERFFNLTILKTGILQNKNQLRAVQDFETDNVLFTWMERLKCLGQVHRLKYYLYPLMQIINCITHYIKTTQKSSFKLLKLFSTINFCSTSNCELSYHL